MKRFKKILTCMKDDPRGDSAFERAVELARANEAALTLIHVVEVPKLLSRFVPGLRDLEKTTERDWSERLEQRAAGLRAEGLEVNTVVRHGRVFLEIIREVLRNGHDLVVKGARGPRDEDTLHLGSTDMHLLRKCPSAVWIVNPETPRIQRLLAAVDPAPPGDRRNPLNIQILEMAATLRERHGAELFVLHAWYPLAEDLRESRESAEDLQEYVRATRKLAEDGMSELLAKLGDLIPSSAVSLHKGDAGSIIPAFARAKKVDLIVMGTLSRSGIAGFLMGNTAESILRRVQCSVLTVKPVGFVSPVELED